MAAINRVLVVVVALVAFAFVALPASDARAQEYYYYYGQHPVPEAWGGGWCEEEGAHYHEYAPVDVEFYEYVEGHYVFVGDPWFHGYTGPLYWYYGPRPIYTPWGEVISYIDGPHLWYAPPPVTVVGWYHTDGYYYYRGAWPAHYRPHYRIHLSHHYPRRYAHYARHAPAGRPPHRPAHSHRVSADPDRHGSGGREPRTRATPPPRSDRERGDSPRYGGERGDSPRYGGQSGRTPARLDRSRAIQQRPATAPRAEPTRERREIPTTPPGYSGRKPSGAKPAAVRPSETGRKPSARPAPSYRSRPTPAPSGRGTTLGSRPGTVERKPAPSPSPRYRTPTPSKGSTPAYRRSPAPSPSRPAVTSGDGDGRKKRYTSPSPSRSPKAGVRRGAPSPSGPKPSPARRQR